MDKLFINKNIKYINLPKKYEYMLDMYKFDASKDIDIILAFVHSLEEMKDIVNKSINILSDNKLLYICYLKLKNRLDLVGIHRDHIFGYLNVDENSGYINDTLMRFNTMRKFDDNYTLLGIKKDVTLKKRSPISEKVDDYLVYVPEILKILENELCLDFFISLTDGYKKSWVRYIFSTKNIETKNKRIKKMIELLNNNIKSIDLKGK